MAETRRPPSGRNTSFRRAKKATEEALYRDEGGAGHLDDLQKYFSPDTWKKMTDLNLASFHAEVTPAEKYFDPAAWAKLQRLGCLGTQPSTNETPAPAPVSAARDCFSPSSWDALVRLNVVPATQTPRPDIDDHDRLEPSSTSFSSDDDDDDYFLGRCMDDCTSLSSAVQLEGAELGPVPERQRLRGLDQYFSVDKLRVLEERGVLQSALERLGKETSV